MIWLNEKFWKKIQKAAAVQAIPLSVYRAIISFWRKVQCLIPRFSHSEAKIIQFAALKSDKYLGNLAG